MNHVTEPGTMQSPKAQNDVSWLELPSRSLRPRAPQRLFFTQGVGRGRAKAVSHQRALMDAGLARCSIAQVSAVIPPATRVLSREEGLQLLRPGEITFAMVSEESTDTPRRRITASLGIAWPPDSTYCGCMVAHHSPNQEPEEVGGCAQAMAAEMLAAVLGEPFGVNAEHDERTHQRKIGNLIVQTTNTTQSAVGDAEELWTTVIAAAVLL